MKALIILAAFIGMAVAAEEPLPQPVALHGDIVLANGPCMVGDEVQSGFLQAYKANSAVKGCWTFNPNTRIAHMQLNDGTKADQHLAALTWLPRSLIGKGRR
jgi:hypothetical protein